MRRIGIIGGGWVGCHLANKLCANHDVTLFEQDEIFAKASSNNQNRLHLGYHYARNFKTRMLCQNTFQRFLDDYEHFTKVIPNNLYCVPDRSNIDFQTYLQIFNDFDHEIAQCSLKHIEGCIQTNERFIDFRIAKEHFEYKIRELVKYERIENAYDLTSQYDLVINATNNELNQIPNSYYEKTITHLFRKKANVDFGAYTLVDGNFFSLYPYDGRDMYTLTCVEHTPLASFSNPKQLLDHRVTLDDIVENRKKMINHILHYYPDFLNDFESCGHFLANKAKPISASADRYPVITKQGNMVSCYTGKIQGIYIIEDYIKNLLETP